ncbi:MAG: prolipoprotein diacylglyceryl transferase family protein [bacterium]
MLSALFSWILRPHPVVFSLGSLTLYTHALFFALGAEVSLLMATFLARTTKLSDEKVGGWILTIFVTGLVAARLGYFISYPSQFQDVSQVLAIWQGGLVSYFGLAGGIGVAFWLLRGMSAAERWRWLDILCVAALAGWAVGRIGNYYAADSVGVASTWWSVFYGRVPIQLFESVLTLILAFSGWQWWGRFKPGGLAVLLSAGYLAGRFIIDMWRDESTAGPLHLSQWVCLLAVILLIPLILRRVRPAAS